MESHLECTSNGRVSIGVPIEDENCVSGRVSSIIETTAERSMQQNNKPSPDIKQLSGYHWTTNTDINHVVVRLWGSGICDAVFSFEEELIVHCSHHCNTPENETFIDLCGHLSSCSCGEVKV